MNDDKAKPKLSIREKLPANTVKIEDPRYEIFYPNISGYAPDHFDAKTGMIVYPVPDAPVTVTIPDNAGNELVLLLSPVDNN